MEIKTFEPNTICLRCFREKKDKPYGYCSFVWGNHYKRHIWNKEAIELKIEKFYIEKI